MPILLTADMYDQIRAAIDTSLDSGQLADSIIELDCFAGRAEAEILSRDKNAASYEPVTGLAPDAAKWARVARAMVFLTAAEISPALPGLVSVRMGDFQWQRAAWDGHAVALRLRGLAAAELDGYLNIDGRVKPLQGMWLARGGRGA